MLITLKWGISPYCGSPEPATGTSVHAALGIARVHDENNIIVLLLLKIGKFVKYFFDLIIYTINTLNE